MKSSRLSRLPKKELKSRSTGSQTYRYSKTAFYVTSPDTAHYPKLHAMLTDHSPLHVSLFTERAAAAKWLGVPLEALSA